MNAKAVKPEVAKSAKPAAKVAQPKSAAEPKATKLVPVAPAAPSELQKPSAATGFSNLPAVVQQPQPEVAKLEPATEEPKQPARAKCVAAHVQKGKPQAKMLRKIGWVGKHPGTALRIKRWHLYKPGMTLQYCKETAGLDHLDVLFYVENGLMKLVEPTQKEYDDAVAAWQKRNEKQKTA